MSVRELLASSAAAVARTLRADLQAAGEPRSLAESAAWLARAQSGGCTTRRVFDEHALTVIVSSWRCEWEDAAFGFGQGAAAAPTAYDHGALAPIVASFVKRPKGEGLHVYASGAKAHVFADELVAAPTGPLLKVPSYEMIA